MSNSALKDLAQLEERVKARAAELLPQVAEYDELVQVAKRIGVEVPTYEEVAAGATGKAKAATGEAKAASRPAPKRRTRATTRRRRVNNLRDPLLELVKAKPGLTVRGAAEELGYADGPTTALYRVTAKLVDEGEVQRRDGGLWPKEPPESSATESSANAGWPAVGLRSGARGPAI